MQKVEHTSLKMLSGADHELANGFENKYLDKPFRVILGDHGAAKIAEIPGQRLTVTLLWIAPLHLLSICLAGGS